MINAMTADAIIDDTITETESFKELFEESLGLTKLQPGSIVTGTVVNVSDDIVMVHAGLKSEGAIPIEEFYNDKGVVDVKVGDEVEVAVDSLEDGFGETVLSREKAVRAHSWTVLEKAHEANETVKIGRAHV